jgi:hypothetical protein
MSIYDKSINNVAAAALKIMAEKLHPNQQKLDVHEPEKDKLTADDFKLLRSKKKVEESEQIDEISKATAKSYTIKKMDAFYANKNKSSDSIKKDLKGLGDAHARLTGAKPTSEEVDLDEGKMGQLSADLTDLSHADFHKEYGKPKSHFDPTNFKKPVQKGKEMDRAKALAQRGMASVKKEEVEELQEYQSKDGVYKHQGTYGRAKGVEHGDTDYDKENEMAKSLDKPKKPNRAKYGARQNFNRSTRVNEDFSNLIDSFKSGGLKALEEGMKTRKEMKEEADNEQFHAEVEKAKKKNSGEDRNDKGVAAASVQAVKNEQTHTEIQVIDMTDPYDIKSETIDLEERSLSEPEADKKEEIVKSMKKKMSGFKERYGDRAKEVMYATATKIAKKD